MDRFVRKTAVGGFLVAGGVVLAASGAAADEAPQEAPSAATKPAPVKKRLLDDAAPASRAAATKAKTASAAKKASTKAAAAPKAATARKAAAASTKRAPASAVTSAKPTPTAAVTAVVAAPAEAVSAVAPSTDSAIAAAVDLPASSTGAPSSLAAGGSVAAPAGTDVIGAPIVGLPSGAPGDGPGADLTLAPLSTAETVATPETASGLPVAGGPPDEAARQGGTAPANVAAVSASPSASTAALTGTSPNGQLSITIDQPLPGTVVPPGSPVLVSGTVRGTGGGSSINVIYVIDISGSTSGAGGACGDVNGDGSSNTILDCEIAGLTALNTSLGSGAIDVSLVTFDSTASTRDVSPAAGVQNTTRPNADVNGNGRPDVVDVLASLGFAGGTNFDAALTAVRPLLVVGEQNFVFFLSDGQSSLSKGAGSPLQAIADAGATVLTFAVGTGTSGCASGQALRDIADVTRGTCAEVTDPSRLSLALTGVSVTGVDRVEILVNGFVGTATVGPLGNFSLLVPGASLQAGRNDIVARAFGSGTLAGQAATADTFVIVGGSVVGASGFDVELFAADFDDDDGSVLTSFADVDLDVGIDVLGDVAGSLPVTGTGAGHLAATGALTFLFGGLLLGSGRHLRRRRRPVVA